MVLAAVAQNGLGLLPPGEHVPVELQADKEVVLVAVE